jgi:hypothetical protein
MLLFSQLIQDYFIRIRLTFFAKLEVVSSAHVQTFPPFLEKIAFSIQFEMMGKNLNDSGKANGRILRREKSV